MWHGMTSALVMSQQYIRVLTSMLARSASRQPHFLLVGVPNSHQPRRGARALALHCPDEEQRHDRQGLPRLAPGGPPRGALAQIMAVRQVILKNLDTDYEEGMM